MKDRKRNKSLGCRVGLGALFALAASASAQAVWTGSGTSWADSASWRSGILPASDTSASVAADGVTARQRVEMPASAAAQGLTVRGTLTGGADFVAGSDVEGAGALSLGAGGLSVEAGAGPVVFGTETGERPVRVRSGAASVWNNASGDPVSLMGGLYIGAGVTLTNGPFRVAGPVGAVNQYNQLNGSGGEVALWLAGDITSVGESRLRMQNVPVYAWGAPVSIGPGFLFGRAGSVFYGDAPLSFVNEAGGPSIVFAQYDNQTLYFRGTGPVTVETPIALCSSSAPNNGALGFGAGSGASVTVQAGFTDTLNGNSQTDTSSTYNRGSRIVFPGSGADVTLVGGSEHGWRESETAASLTIVAENSGANFLSLSAGDGPKTFAPFGRRRLTTNQGQTTFLRALEPGLVISNGITLGASCGNDGGRPFGFASEYDFTLAGGYYASGSAAATTVLNMGEGDVTFGGEIRVNGSNSWTLEQGGFHFNEEAVWQSATNRGTLRLNPSRRSVIAGRNEGVGMLELSGAEIVFDYEANAAGKFPTATNNAAALVLQGADLRLRGAWQGRADGVAADAGTRLAAGRNSLYREGGGTGYVDLGALTFENNAAGGMLDLEAGVASVRTPVDGATLLTGNANCTVQQSDWATAGADCLVCAVTNYVPLAEAGSTDHVLVSGSEALTGGKTVGTVKVVAQEPGGSLSIPDNATLRINRNGLLVTGSEDFTVSGGSGASLACENSYLRGLMVHHYGDGLLTLDARLTGHRFFAGGSGTTRLAATNAVSQGYYLYGGRLLVSSPANFTSASVPLELNGGTLVPEADLVLSNRVTIGRSGARLEIPAGCTLTLAGVLSGTTGSLRASGEGSLVLSGANTFMCPVAFDGVRVTLGSQTALSADAAATRRTSAPVFLNGATLDLAGFSPNLSFVRLTGGATLTDSVGGGVLRGYGVDLREGTVDASLGDLESTFYRYTDNPMPVYKRGAGTVTVRKPLLHSGRTQVEAGRLICEAPLQNSPVCLTGGEFWCASEIGGSLNAKAGRIVLGTDPESGESLGTLTVGGGMGLQAGSVLSIGVAADRHGQLVFTDRYARICIDGAELDLTRLPGSGQALMAGIVILRNDGILPIEGAFANLPEGVQLPIGNGNSLVMTYVGGDGNDAVLTMLNHASLFLVR